MKAPILHIESWSEHVLLAGFMCAMVLFWASVGYRNGFTDGKQTAFQEIASKTNRPPESSVWTTNAEFRTWITNAKHGTNYVYVEYWATNTFPDFTGKTWKAEEPTPRQRMERDLERSRQIHQKVNEAMKQ